MYKLERQRNQISNCQHKLDNRKTKWIKKKIYFYFSESANAFDSVDQKKVENS